MKKTAAATLALMVVFSGFLAGCGPVISGSGNLITETFDYKDFTAIEAHQGFQVEVVRSNDFEIEITFDDNLKEFLRIEKSGRTLEMRLQQNRSYNSTTLIARITMPDIEKLDLSGGSGADVSGFTLSHDLFLELSGGSHVTGELTAENVEIELSGGSQTALEGSADNLILDSSGGSQLIISSFSVENADIKISGGGRSEIDVSGLLNLDLSGGSQVLYSGEPRLGDVKLSGGSTINNR